MAKIEFSEKSLQYTDHQTHIFLFQGLIQKPCGSLHLHFFLETRDPDATATFLFYSSSRVMFMDILPNNEVVYLSEFPNVIEKD